MDNFLVSLAMVLYMAFIVGIGLYFYRRSNESSDNYFIGGRSLGPVVTAMSAEASDMSGWLLMGLPGVAYFFGLADAFWTALGLAIGTYINWLIVAKPLRVYSHVADDSITIPDFFSNRYNEGERKPIMVIAAIFIMIFFIVYVSSCFVTVGKLFTTLFNIDYKIAMTIGAVFVVAYTFIGGFLAESVSDFVQSIVMIMALVLTVAFGINEAGGVDVVLTNLKEFPGFIEFFATANPTMENGQQVVSNGLPVYGIPNNYGWLQVISTLSWGLGYFGVPQVLIKFMAIRDPEEIKISRRIASIWVVISLGVSVFIGLMGRYLYPIELLNLSEAESIFIIMGRDLMPAFFAGLMMAGILAATISSADSYLLISTSAVSRNLYKRVFKKDASDQEVMRVSRISLIAIALLSIVFALDENSVIFSIVSFAWAGFGATFGPLMLFSLFYKKTTKEAAVAGMISGGLTVFIWNIFVKPLGGIFRIYELLPAFIISSIAIFVVSQLTSPDVKTVETFEEYQKQIN